MKRLFTLCLVLMLVFSSFSAIVTVADAAEMKSGIGIVNTGALRLRSEPSTDSEVIATALRDDAVVIMDQSGDWYKVVFNLKVGYMHKDYLIVKQRENVKLGYAEFESVTNVRKGPGTDTAVVAQAPKGETCFIIGFNTGWYKVSYNGQIGYVRSDLVGMLEIPYSNAGSPGNTYKEAGKQTAAEPEAAKQESSKSENAKTENTKTESSQKTEAPASGSSSLGEKISAYAQQFVGYRYVYGGSSPSTGFDCSGLTSYVAKQFGYSIGRTANAQLSAGSYVSRGDLQPGDIVLFERTYSSSEKATHAGIYIGGGKFVHAANSRTGVVITNLGDEYYSTRFICGRRLG